MKAIMISIRPKYVAKILNGEKTIEIRKKFPSDYVGWVYIYCTKNGGYLHLENDATWSYSKNKKYTYIRTGKVVARFWCDKVEEIKLNFAMRFFTKSMNEEELLKQSCLASKELENYLLPNLCYGKTIHITKLEIFDKPKEISEFYRIEKLTDYKNKSYRVDIKKAPQSWCYVEI